MDDRIASVEARAVRVPLPKPLQLGSLYIPHRDYCLVRIRTRDGVEGQAFGLTRGMPIAEVVRQSYAQALVGADPIEPLTLWRDSYDSHIAAGRTGLGMRALSLLDIALWDIKARKAGLPLWRLLGGSATPVEAIMVAGYPTGQSAEELAERVCGYGDQGYRYVKLARSADPSFTAALLAQCTKDLAPTSKLVLDAAWFWRTAYDAAAELRSMDLSRLAWLEDPMPAEDLPGYERLAQLVTVPIGVGDEVTDASLYSQFLRSSAADVIRIDATCCGGITGAHRIMQASRLMGKKVSFHVYPDIHRHLAAVDPTSLIECFDNSDNPFDPTHLLMREPVQVAPLATPTDDIGLGFELRWESIDTVP